MSQNYKKTDCKDKIIIRHQDTKQSGKPSNYWCRIALVSLMMLGMVVSLHTKGGEAPALSLKIRSIDASLAGKQPDASAAIDINGDGKMEVLTSIDRGSEGWPTVFLYNRDNDGEWNRTKIGFHKKKGDAEWVAVGRPFPGDSRVCVALSVQHQKDGLAVFRLRKQGLSPFDPDNWEKGVANDTAGQGLAFHDLNNDNVDELIYATQRMNELGVLSARKDGDPMKKSGWTDHVIDSGNNRAWWWLDGKFYDLNDNGVKTDFFVSTRSYGGSDLGMWKVVQNRPNDLSSYEAEKVYNGNSLWFDTGYFFSGDRNRKPDIVMADYKRNEIHFMDGRDDYEVTSIPFKGKPWNVKIIPGGGTRDSFVVCAEHSSSLFWSFRWRDGKYEVREETEFKGNYGHPMDGTFTIADVDDEDLLECIVPDSSASGKRSKGLAYLDLVPTTSSKKKPTQHFSLGE